MLAQSFSIRNRNRYDVRLLEAAVGQGFSGPRTGTGGYGSNGWVGYNRRGCVRVNAALGFGSGIVLPVSV